MIGVRQCSKRNEVRKYVAMLDKETQGNNIFNKKNEETT